MSSTLLEDAMSQGEKQFTNVLDTFDHVVVLMLENRSFDSLLGYLYSQEYPVPPGQKFEGVDGQNLSNPIPSAYQFEGKNGKWVREVLVDRISDIDLTAISPPYPDPGEDYPHVNTQLFNVDKPQPCNQPPYNLPSSITLPTMKGFVADYIQNYIYNEGMSDIPTGEKFYEQYKYIMESYDPKDISVLSGLAREFAVFDHWFCSVPSETICNRNFWHAGTSWGHVINPGPGDDPGDENNKSNTDSWLSDTLGDTLFSQLWLSGIKWKVYIDNKIPLPEHKNLSLPVTPLLHLWNFLPLLLLDPRDVFNTLEDFKNDCAKGQLPAYSFLEPNFFNPHNDMHPSTPGETIDGNPQAIGSVLLGEALVWEVYNAIFTSSGLWNNTLLIITFDEHGGCYDHVCPPGHYGGCKVDPAEIATPPDLSGHTKWDGFDFNRLGLRVPMIMVSPYIKKNTIINTSMSHTSFLKTMHEKLGLPSLSVREDKSPSFHDCGLLWPTLQRKEMSDMPVFAAPVIPPDPTDYSQALLSALAKALMALIKEAWCKAFPAECPPQEIRTQQDAAEFLRETTNSAKIKLGRLDAVRGQINDHDWALLLRAIAGKLKNNKPQ